MIQIPEGLETAFELFLQELDGHLEFFGDLLSKLAAADEAAFRELLSENERKISHKFHTVKGAAGFLQQKDLADQADQAERLFKSKVIFDLPRAEALQALQRHVNELQQFRSAASSA